MIELTDEQRRCVDQGQAVAVQEDGREYVLLRRDVYTRLTEYQYDDSPWDAEEMDHLREESVAMLDRYGKVAMDLS